MDRPVDAFKLQLEAAATPERVAAAATFLGRVLRAASPDLPEGSITLVVTNYNMGAAVRARTAEGRKAAKRFLLFLENPTRMLDSDPSTRNLAEALATPGDALLSATIFRPRARRPLAVIDQQFARHMHALANATEEEPCLRGPTTVYSPVYRVGRWDENKTIKARIRMGGEPHDIALADERIAPDFFKAAMETRAFPVRLAAVWVRRADGRLQVDAKRTLAVSVDLSWAPITGADFVEAVQQAAPSGYPGEDIDERVEKILLRRHA